MKTVLITGGAGFIGSRVALRLVSLGYRVRVLDCLAPQIHGPDPERSPLYLSIRGAVEFTRGSVTDAGAVDAVLDGADVVVHLAAETGTGQSMYAIRRYSDVNVGGTAVVLEGISSGRFSVRKIVVASSRAIYGEGKYSCIEHGAVFPGSRLVSAMEVGDFDIHCPLCGRVAALCATDEASPLSPASVYGVTKLTQEQMVLTVARSLGLSAVAFRYQNVFGPGQSLSNPYTGILSIFSTRIRNGNAIDVYEDGKESRDFVFIDDVVEATVRGVEIEVAAPIALNVGSGVATDVLTVAHLLRDMLGRAVPIAVTRRFRVGDVRHNVADLINVRSTLGFQPAVSFEEGLRRFVAWVETQSVQADGYDRSVRELQSRGLFK